MPFPGHPENDGTWKAFGHLLKNNQKDFKKIEPSGWFQEQKNRLFGKKTSLHLHRHSCPLDAFFRPSREMMALQMPLDAYSRKTTRVLRELSFEDFFGHSFYIFFSTCNPIFMLIYVLFNCLFCCTIFNLPVGWFF